MTETLKIENSSAKVCFRCNEEDRQLFAAAAKAESMALGTWIRHCAKRRAQLLLDADQMLAPRKK